MVASLDLRPWEPPENEAGRGRHLKYSWLKAIERLENTPSPHPVKIAWTACVSARMFVRKWADWAERAGMQPAHLLSYRDESSRGLAWRWTRQTDLLCFPRPGHIIIEVEGPETAVCHTYRFELDGSLYKFRPAEHAVIMKQHCQLLERPSRRVINLMNDIAADRTMINAFSGVSLDQP